MNTTVSFLKKKIKKIKSNKKQTLKVKITKEKNQGCLSFWKLLDN